MPSIERFGQRCFAVAVPCFLLLCGSALYGQGQQTATATLSGSVNDPSGLAVSGAKVTLTSRDIGIARTQTTGVAGLYSFPLLPGGTYALQVDSAGFKTYQQGGITLEPGQSVTQNVNLVIGSTTEAITVTSQAPLLNAENANISSDVTAKQIVDLPLNYRSVISLAMLNSSVQNNAEFLHLDAGGMTGTADQDISFLNFGGTFFDTAAYLVDGSWDTRDDWGGVIYVPSADTVQEFKIQTNAFTAQYGFSAGNVVNIITKSGTNQFHGDAYLFYRNSSLDAVQDFLTRTSYTRKQFGGTIGGPIRRNKTFFFASYEGLRQALASGRIETVPTTAERNGDFSGDLGALVAGKTDYEGRPIYTGEMYNPFSTRAVTCGGNDPATGLAVNKGCTTGTTYYIRDGIGASAGNGWIPTNIIPAALLDKVALKIANGNYWPAPTGKFNGGNIEETGTAPESSDEYSVRADHNFSDNTRAYARWSQKYEQKTNLPDFYGATDPGGPGLVNPNNRFSSSVGYNHIFSPSFVVSASLGVNRHVEGGLTQGWGFNSSTLGLPSFVDTIAPEFPQLTESNYANLGATGGNNNYITPQTQTTTAVDFTKEHGHHQFAFGFMDAWLRHNGGHYGTTNLAFSNGGYGTGGPDPTKVTSGTGNGFGSFMLGVGTGTTAYTAFPAQSKHFLGWYFQDTWKITSKLTLNPGLRYEIQTPYTERYNAMENFNLTAPNPISSAVKASNLPAGSPAAVLGYIPGEIVYMSPSGRDLYQTTWKNFAPRIGFAYQALKKLVIRGGYGVFYEPNIYQGGNNNGYSQTTTWLANFDGVTPGSTLGGNPGATCLLALPGTYGPCPAAFSTGEVPPTGNGQGGLTNVGLGSGGINPIRKSPYVEQWTLGLEFGVTNNDLLDVSYVGNVGIHNLYGSLAADNFTAGQLAANGAAWSAATATVANPFYGQINGATGYQIPGSIPGTTTPSSCSLDQPTIKVAQLYRPYPEFCGVSDNMPDTGTSNYNSLQLTYKRRLHSGLDLNVSYTFSKFLSNGEGQSASFYASGTYGLGATNFQDVYNLAAEKSVDASDMTHSLVTFYDYELPFGAGKMFGAHWNRPVKAVLGGWSLSGIFTAKSGLPVSITEGSLNDAGVTGVGGAGAQRPNLVPGISPVPAHQSIASWINPAAFVQPAPYTYGDAPRYLSNLRGPDFINWDMGIHKSWPFHESKRLEFRCEMFNSLNHPNFFLPGGDLSNSKTFGIISQAFPARSVQFAGKFYF
jgi:hypothetical protein